MNFRPEARKASGVGEDLWKECVASVMTHAERVFDSKSSDEVQNEDPLLLLLP